MASIYKVSIGKYSYFGKTTLKGNRRATQHLVKLKNKTHCNRKMQSVFDKYQDFKYDVMLTCEDSELAYYEQTLLDAYVGQKACLNLSKESLKTTKGLAVSNETRQKLSLAKQKKEMFTFKHEEGEVITCTQHSLVKDFNLDRGHVSQVVNGKRKSHKGWRIN